MEAARRCTKANKRQACLSQCGTCTPTSVMPERTDWKVRPMCLCLPWRDCGCCPLHGVIQPTPHSRQLERAARDGSFKGQAFHRTRGHPTHISHIYLKLSLHCPFIPRALCHAIGRTHAHFDWGKHTVRHSHPLCAHDRVPHGRQGHGEGISSGDRELGVRTIPRARGSLQRHEMERAGWVHTLDSTGASAGGITARRWRKRICAPGNEDKWLVNWWMGGEAGSLCCSVHSVP